MLQATVTVRMYAGSFEWETEKKTTTTTLQTRQSRSARFPAHRRFHVATLASGSNRLHGKNMAATTGR